MDGHSSAFEAKNAYWRVLDAASKHFDPAAMGGFPSDTRLTALLSAELRRYLPRRAAFGLASRLESSTLSKAEDASGPDRPAGRFAANGVEVGRTVMDRERMAVVAVSLYEGDGSRRGEAALLSTLRHEALHALRTMGVFSPSEWISLRKAAQAGGWRRIYDVERRWGEYYSKLDPDRREEALDEEAIAERFSAWVKENDAVRGGGGELPGMSRAAAFLDAAGRGVRGLFGIRGEDSAGRGWRSVFAAAVSGGLGRRVEEASSPDAARQKEILSKAVESLRATDPDSRWRLSSVEREDGAVVPALVQDPAALCVLATCGLDPDGPGRFVVYDPGDRRGLGPSLADPSNAAGAAMAADGALGSRSLLSLRLAPDGTDVSKVLSQAVSRVRSASLIESGIVKARTDEEGLAHCEDGPAVVHSNGRCVWMRHGVVDRADGPADCCPTKGNRWLRQGALHRIGGPAVESPDGSFEWFEDGSRRTPSDPEVMAYAKSAPPAQKAFIAARAVGGSYIDLSGPERRIPGPNGSMLAIYEVRSGGERRIGADWIEDFGGSTESRRPLPSCLSLEDAFAAAGEEASIQGGCRAEDAAGMFRLNLLRSHVDPFCVLNFDEAARLRSIDGRPAVADGRGNAEWREEGRLSRKDGPAVETADGGWEWFEAGRPRVPSAAELSAYARGGAPRLQSDLVLESEISGVYADVRSGPLEFRHEGDLYRISRLDAVRPFVLERIDPQGPRHLGRAADLDSLVREGAGWAAFRVGVVRMSEGGEGSGAGDGEDPRPKDAVDSFKAAAAAAASAKGNLAWSTHRPGASPAELSLSPGRGILASWRPEPEWGPQGRAESLTEHLQAGLSYPSSSARTAAFVASASRRPFPEGFQEEAAAVERVAEGMKRSQEVQKARSRNAEDAAR